MYEQQTPAKIAATVDCDEDRYVIASTFAERLVLAMARGNWQQVQSICATAQRELEAKTDPLGTRTLAALGVPTRIVNYLAEQLDVVYVADLLGWQTERVLRVANMGPTSVDEVWRAVLRAALKAEGGA